VASDEHAGRQLAGDADMLVAVDGDEAIAAALAAVG
jgi:hypothetical protein